MGKILDRESFGTHNSWCLVDDQLWEISADLNFGESTAKSAVKSGSHR